MKKTMDTRGKFINIIVLQNNYFYLSHSGTECRQKLYASSINEVLVKHSKIHIFKKTVYVAHQEDILHCGI